MASRNVLALFDFDGTITFNETMPVFVRSSVSRWRMLLGYPILLPWILGYRWGLVSGTRVRSAIVRFGYSGASNKKLIAAGEAFARDCLPTVLRPVAMEKIAWHKAQGHRVIVVSGGLDVYLQPWCDLHGLELLCSSLERNGDSLTGRYAGGQCVREEKARRVQSLPDFAQFSEIYAYGDTPEDHAMLGLATIRVYGWDGAVQDKGRK